MFYTLLEQLKCSLGYLIYFVVMINWMNYFHFDYYCYYCCAVATFQLVIVGPKTTAVDSFSMDGNLYQLQRQPAVVVTCLTAYYIEQQALRAAFLSSLDVPGMRGN